MTTAHASTANPTTIRLLGPADGLVPPGAGQVTDRFMIDGSDTDQRFALVQHVFAPRALAAPVHRHHLEDEFTYVLTGTIGAVLGEEEVLARPGDLLFKPRDQWHTFWNAGDEPATVLELISPAGLEQFFRWLGELEEFPAPDVLAERARPYRCDVDETATSALMERLGRVGS
ncbi:MAG TPA: cupin domain-containing protein [Mycobacteriales bacterium]|nr:cupin domain-containing protein [Mycobacteriales bacterium]